MTTDFDAASFMKRDKEARWLLWYDRVAWLTSDLVLEEPPEIFERLGPVWFCMEHEGTWHALYGRFDAKNDEYHAVLHYEETADGFERSRAALPQAEVNSLARALHNVLDRASELLGHPDVRFNPYVRRLGAERIEVWMLPAWQPDGQLAFGTEYHAVLDGEGRRILEETPPSGTLTLATPSPEGDFIIPNEDSDLPSVGDIFVVLLVHGTVKLAAIRNREYTSAYADLSGSGDYHWVQVQRAYDLDDLIENMRQLYKEGQLDDPAEQ